MSLATITHYTVTSALGAGLVAHRDALLAGRSGLKRLPFETCKLPCWLGEVRGMDQALPRSHQLWDCRNHRLAWLALAQDGFLAAAAQLRERHGPARVGVFVGTSTSGILSAELAYRERGADGSLPDWFDYRHTHCLHSTAAFVAHALELAGHTLAISTACSSSAKVFAAAWRSMQSGFCDAAIVGGVDSLCLTTLYGFNSLQLLSADVCRPADAARAGISIGEAAGFAILERPGRDHTVRGAARLLGYGESSDAHHMSAPHPEGLGAVLAMRAALQRAGLEPGGVDYINLHGTGTQANDAAEDRAVHALFGNATPCSSTKGWTGHTLGAAGMVEAAMSLMCIDSGLQPQSLQTQQLDPALRSQVLMQSRRAPVRTVLSNSFGFGGSNCSLLFGAAA
jgi:3-oxoacyl-[acyl-carrier-protein] synthase-1